VLSIEERGVALGKLNDGIRRCPKCPLSRTRTQSVPGEGPVDADIMFIGEAPGYYEDQQGRPFIGAAGKFLEELLASIGLKRTDVFIANVIKCRPPSNRDPLPGEIEACGDWLAEQEQIISPKIIVTLGRYSLARYFPGMPISRIHGQARKVNGQWVVPMYHPAAALHQASLRSTIEFDFKKLPGYVEQAMRDYEESVRPLEPVVVAPQPEQMKLPL
jgi:DNA polymerase